MQDFDFGLLMAVRFDNEGMDEAIRETAPMILSRHVEYVDDHEAEIIVTDHLRDAADHLESRRHVIHYCFGQPCDEVGGHPPLIRNDLRFHLVLHEEGSGATVFGLVLQDVAKTIAKR